MFFLLVSAELLFECAFMNILPWNLSFWTNEFVVGILARFRLITQHRNTRKVHHYFHLWNSPNERSWFYCQLKADTSLAAQPTSKLNQRKKPISPRKLNIKRNLKGDLKRSLTIKPAAMWFTVTWTRWIAVVILSLWSMLTSLLCIRFRSAIANEIIPYIVLIGSLRANVHMNNTSKSFLVTAPILCIFSINSVDFPFLWKPFDSFMFHVLRSGFVRS